MNHHFRSQSEQQQPLQNQRQQHQQLHSTSNSTNIVNGDPQADQQPDSSSTPSAGIIRVHSDSQQSLDRLFNLSNSQASIPLRNRNLPASFFNPSWRTNGTSTQQQTGPSNSFHSRSTSFATSGQQNGVSAGNNIHMRAQSSIAPMTGLMGSLPEPQSPPSSDNTSAQQQQLAGQPQAPAPAPVVGQQQPQAPMPQQRTSHHYRNFSSPAFMNTNSSQVFPSYSSTVETSSQNANPNPISSRIVEETTTPFVYMEANMTDEMAAQQPPPVQPAPAASNHQDSYNQYHYYPQQAAQPSTYFAGDASSHEQKFLISRSRPYTIYDQNSLNHSSSSSSSTNLLAGAGGPSALAPSSSSSSENNSTPLCGIPTPAVHSRSSSFEERPAHPSIHSRSQSAAMGAFRSSNFVSPTMPTATTMNQPPNFARPIIMMGASNTAVGPAPAGAYGQATLSTAADEQQMASGADDWNHDMIM